MRVPFLCLASFALGCDQPIIDKPDGDQPGMDAGPDGGAMDASRDAGPIEPDAGMEDAGRVIHYDAGPRPPSPTFTDVTEAAGLAEVHRRPAACIAIGINSENCEIDAMTGGAAVGDVDADGWPDLYVTMLEGPDRLYRNLGDGTFADMSEEAGLSSFSTQSNGAAFADIDEDGDLDLYVTTIGAEGDAINARYYLFVNDGSGRFTEQAVARGVALDDGKHHSGQSIAVGDYDRDGYVDLFVTEWLPRASSRPHNRLFHNRGASMPGYFEDATVTSGAMTFTQQCWDELVPCTTYLWGAAFTDLDEDGWPDLVAVADFSTTKLFWNRGGGLFNPPFRTSSIMGDENGMGSTVGDIDGDGDLDVFVTSIYDAEETCMDAPCNWRYSGNRLYLNEGARTWSDGTDQFGVRDVGWGWGAAMFDHDNDGDLDLAATAGVDFPTVEQEDVFHDDPMRFWDNDGAGGMRERAREVGLTDTASGKGLVVFDFDRDGDLDIFVRNNGALPRLYRNDGGDALGWLRVRCIGTTSTSEALGARLWLRVRPEGPRQEVELGSVTHYLGQSERIVHFGLGVGEANVAELDVRWPSGRMTRLTDVPANQVLELTEP